MNRRDALATAAGFAVAGAVLLILATVVGLEAVLSAIGRADPLRVALVGVAILGWLVCWSGALRAVVGALGAEISLREAILVAAGGTFANHVTPFGQAGGEPVTAWLLADVGDVEYERALAAVTSYDTVHVVPSLALATMGGGYYAATAALGRGGRALVVGIGVLAVGAPVLGVVVWRRRRTLGRELARAVGTPLAVLDERVPWLDLPGRAVLVARIDGFVGALERIASDRRRLAIAVGLSTAGWVCQAAGLWIAFWALEVTVPVFVPLFVVTLGAMAGALPTPGGLGGIETVQVGILTAVTSVAAATITAAVAISSVGGFLFTTSLGAAAVTVLRVRSRSV